MIMNHFFCALVQIKATTSAKIRELFSMWWPQTNTFYILTEWIFSNYVLLVFLILLVAWDSTWAQSSCTESPVGTNGASITFTSAKRFAASPSTVHGENARRQKTDCYTGKAGQGCRMATTQQLLLCMFQFKLSETDSRSVAWRLNVLCVLTGQHCATLELPGMPLIEMPVA